MIRGSCSCGAVGFALTPPTDFCAHCHCRSCRKASGAAFLTWTSVPRDRFSLERGADSITWYASSETIEWGFCRICGTTLLYRAVAEGHAEAPRTGCVYVTVAALDDPLDRAPAAHVSFEERVPWHEPGDGLPRFEGKTDERLPSAAPLFVLYVADQAASARFYSAALAAAPTLDVPGMTELPLPGGGQLGLMPEAGIGRLLGIDAPASRPPRAELYLRVPDPAAAHARALAAGGTELAPLQARDWGDDVAYSADADGHVLAFARRTGTADPREAELLARLDAMGIAHELWRHEPVYTVAEAKALRGSIDATHIKNLFLRDKKGGMWLLTVPEDRTVDLKALRAPLGARGRLSLGSAERLERYLGVTPGAVTPVAVMADAEGAVTLVLDEALRQTERIAVHPMHNAATIALATADLVRFVVDTGHPPVWLG